MLEQFHAEPVEINSNHEDRESQGHQKAVIPTAGPNDKKKKKNQAKERQKRKNKELHISLAKW